MESSEQMFMEALCIIVYLGDNRIVYQVLKPRDKLWYIYIVVISRK